MSVMDRINPNRAARRERAAALLAEAAGAPARGDVVRIERESGVVDLVRVTGAFTSPASGIRMITVRTIPHGILSSTVRADSVVPADSPDVRHDATECGADCLVHEFERLSALAAESLEDL
jgi:hypothetical protein